MYILYPKYQPVGRRERKAFEKEQTKALTKLAEVEFRFLAALFSPEFEEDPRMTYQNLYREALDLWNAAIVSVENYGLKYHNVNKNYFANEFKPLETYE